MTESSFIGMLCISLGTLVGLFFTVGKPIIKLNTTLTKALSRLDAVEERQKENRVTLKDIQEKSHDSHRRIHARIDNVENRVDEIDNRVLKLENTK